MLMGRWPWSSTPVRMIRSSELDEQGSYKLYVYRSGGSSSVHMNPYEAVQVVQSERDDLDISKATPTFDPPSCYCSGHQLASEPFRHFLGSGSALWCVRKPDGDAYGTRKLSLSDRALLKVGTEAASTFRHHPHNSHNIVVVGSLLGSPQSKIRSNLSNSAIAEQDNMFHRIHTFHRGSLRRRIAVGDLRLSKVRQRLSSTRPRSKRAGCSEWMPFVCARCNRDRRV